LSERKDMYTKMYTLSIGLIGYSKTKSTDTVKLYIKVGINSCLCTTLQYPSYIHRVPKKTCDYIFYNNFNNRCPITVIFGTVSSKSMRHRMMHSFPTSPI